jgi:hypothetical protein
LLRACRIVAQLEEFRVELQQSFHSTMPFPSVRGAAADDPGSMCSTSPAQEQGAPPTRRHPSLRAPDDPRPTLESLPRNRSTASLSGSLRAISRNMPHRDEGSTRPADLDAEEARRPTATERRLSQILAQPQIRSLGLIGNSSPRYRWERYWKSEGELKQMKKPMYDPI